MKKLGIYLMSVLALGFVACDDYDEAIPQANEQQQIVAVNGLEVAADAGLQAPVDLNNVVDPISLIQTVKTPELNEGNGIDYDVQIAKDENFSEVKQYALTNGALDPAKLNEAYRAFYGKIPYEKPLYLRFIPYLSDGSSRVLFAKDTYLLASSLAVTPIDNGIVVEPEYYVVTDVWFGDGWAENAVALTHEGTDLYEEPYFSALIEMEAGSFQIFGTEGFAKAKQEPGSEYLYAWGAQSGDFMTGDLVYGEKGQPIVIAEKGLYQVRVNMLERTYTVTKIIPTMYMIGGFCSWSWDNCSELVPSGANTSDAEGKYWILNYVGEKEGFKFNSSKAWDGGEFGFAGATMKSYVAGVDFVDDGGNMALTKAGWYLFCVEKKLVAGKATYTVCVFEPKVYLYGPAAGGSWGDNDAWLFTVPATADGEFVSPAFAADALGDADGGVRICVHPMADGAQYLGEWWQTEFIFFDGKIAYRGRGGDQARVSAKAGQKAYLNFKAGTAYIK